MKIAVVGAGFAGLAFSWYYSKFHPEDELFVFDPTPIHQRASSRAFLLHPFIHFKSLLNWKGREAFSAAHNLLEETSSFSNEPFYLDRPFLKLANHPSQKDPFIKAASLYTELAWQEQTDYGFSGLQVQSASQVSSEIYLSALENGCRARKVHFISKTFLKRHEGEFDRILYASGHQSNHWFSNLNCSEVKGQLLQIRWPSSCFKLPTALTAYKCHLVPSFDQKTILIGSTFERNFKEKEPDLKQALELLTPNIHFLWPNFDPSWVLSVSSGIRLNAQNRLPLLGQIDRKRWLFAALGSKGLLYHAYLGKLLAQHFKTSSAQLLPKELHVPSSAASALGTFCN